MFHFDDDTLSRYAEGTSLDSAEIERHVSECDDCSIRVGGHRHILETLRTADVWEKEPPSPPRKLVFDVVAFATRAKDEEQHARALCDEILSGPSSWWPQRLSKAPGAKTAGMVKELLDRMRQLIERSPSNALQVTAMAIDVAETLDVAEYPCDYVIKLRAQAFRDHAYVLSFLGRYPDALEFAEHSKRLFDQVPLPEYDLARLSLVRASILRCIDRAPEAIQLSREAASVFLRYGDRARFVNARIWEANAVFETGAFEEALAIWKSLEGDPDVDAMSQVRLIHNIALSYRQLGHLELAVTYLQRSAEEFDFLGLHTERTRSRSSLGQTLMAAGRHADSIPIFRQTWHEFEALDLVADAGLAALQLAEALLVTGQTGEVAAICRSLIARFTAANMTSRAMTALSFLREAVAIGQATPSLVRHVHDFLRELPAERPRLFAAPPPGNAGD